MVYRPSVFLAHEDCILLDTESLADDAFEFLVCMRSIPLPVRVGGNLWLEPYYPNRFARQFGFDQVVPANKLLFSVCERKRCGIEKFCAKIPWCVSIFYAPPALKNALGGEMRFDDILFPREMEPINADNPGFEVISSGKEENIHHESANSNMGGSGSDLLAEESDFQQVQNSPADD
ncbi:hypothetical protein L3X38_042895 [Prunus dulcis]|uniref:Uncharacterized protein n=1 Tax=Prunus dulcis TaxID=3755 RepID=A0AAD4YLZ6_PRUDU|nr:hypothetical protein L3X38_042895 [Prunus dulcis]